jgi:hypothetical protein
VANPNRSLGHNLKILPKILTFWATIRQKSDEIQKISKNSWFSILVWAAGWPPHDSQKLFNKIAKKKVKFYRLQSPTKLVDFWSYDRKEKIHRFFDWVRFETLLRIPNNLWGFFKMIFCCYGTIQIPWCP